MVQHTDPVKVEVTGSPSSDCAPTEELQQLKIIPLAGVDINEAAAKLQSRGDASRDNIFEILPRFSISSGNEDSDEENRWTVEYMRRREEVRAATSGGDPTGITVGSRFVAFERDTEEPLKQLKFPALVDFIVWRRSIILVGLSSSKILLVDPKSFCVRYAGKPLAKNHGALNLQEKFFVDAFIHSNPDPTKIDVVVVSRLGLVYRFSDISLSDGTLDSTYDQNVSLDVDFGAVREMLTFDVAIESEVVCTASPTGKKVITLEKYGRLTLLDMFDYECTSSSFHPSTGNIFHNLNLDMTKCTVNPSKLVVFEGVLFVLLSNGSLEIFGGVDLIPTEPLRLPKDTMKVQDFTLIRNNNEETVKLWALYGEGSDVFLGIFKGPRFKQEFTFQLPKITQNGAYSPKFMFPSNVSPFEEPVSILEMTEMDIRLYHILETSTDVTLQKLLARGKYLEAEDLAREYSKDLDTVRKAEAKDKLGRLTSNSNLIEGRMPSEELFRELLEVLKKIADSEFVCNFSVQANLPKVDWVKAILALGKTRISGCYGTAAANSLLLTIKKLYTFELVYPSGTIMDWNSFIDPDNTMYLQSVKFLQNECFDKCEKVWRRHSEDFVPLIGLGEFLPFFNVLFDTQLKKPESRSLLQTILPFAVEKVAGSPDNMEEISDSDADVGMQELSILFNIILRQVTTLEGNVNWPVNALDFIKALNVVIELEMKRLEGVRSERESYTRRKRKIVGKINAKLNNLVLVLEELADLKRNHSIRIPFDDYTNNEIVEVVSKLLYKLLSREDVEGFVTKYLKPYAERKRLNLDFLFSEHIKAVLLHIHYYHQAINIPHEERIVTLINFISSSKVKLKCTLSIAQEWPVPWTPGIDSMVKQILDIFPRDKLSPECVRLYDDIFLMKKQVPYRCVLRKYRLNAVKLGTSKCYVTMALLRILKLKKEGYREDCQELLKNIPGNTLLDGIRLEYLEFCTKMYDELLPPDEVVSVDLLKNVMLKKAASHRVLLELRQFEAVGEEDFYSLEEQQRIIEIYETFAAVSRDPNTNMAAKLKKFLPSIPLMMIYDEKFPYIILTKIVEAPETCSNDPQKLIKNCERLSQITNSFLPDILLAMGAFYTMPDFPGNPWEMVWTIVDLIVKWPLSLDQNNSVVNRDYLQHAGFEMAKYLLAHCPMLSLDQMEILDQFLCRIMGFDEICEGVTKLHCFYRIFLNLKEQEIPLEEEYLLIYKWLAGEVMPWDVIKRNLIKVGATLLRFGELDLYNSVFKSTRRHLLLFASELEEDDPMRNNYFSLIKEIETLMEDLWSRRNSYSPDNDRLLGKLVKQLNDAGIRVNIYALKLRNKEKLIERLLNQRNYILASDLAIAFRFYGDMRLWSRILQGFISTGKLQDLRLVLESVRTVPELWMLEEFAQAWRRVSEVDPSFLDLCPIPLE